jgi:hypothetical protein
MNDISEMWVSNPSEGDVLTYKDGYWRNVTPSNSGGGGGGDNSSLSLDISRSQSGATLSLKEGTTTITSANLSLLHLSDLYDVSSSTPNTSDTLRWAGTYWVPST